jgi:hypothetical protein
MPHIVEEQRRCVSKAVDTVQNAAMARVVWPSGFQRVDESPMAVDPAVVAAQTAVGSRIADRAKTLQEGALPGRLL